MQPVQHIIFSSLFVCPFAILQEFLLMFMWYGMGFTLYVTKMPERFFPKR